MATWRPGTGLMYFGERWDIFERLWVESRADEKKKREVVKSGFGNIPNVLPVRLVIAHVLGAGAVMQIFVDCVGVGFLVVSSHRNLHQRPVSHPAIQTKRTNDHTCTLILLSSSLPPPLFIITASPNFLSIPPVFFRFGIFLIIGGSNVTLPT